MRRSNVVRYERVLCVCVSAAEVCVCVAAVLRGEGAAGPAAQARQEQGTAYCRAVCCTLSL